MAKKRADGEGTIYKLPNGSFRTSVSLGVSADGKRKRKTFTSTSREEVVAKLLEFRELQSKGRLVVSKTTTFETYAKHWLKLKKSRVKETTYRSYENVLDVHFYPEFGSIPIQRITTPMLNSYFTEGVSKDLSTSSLRRHKAILSNLFNIAVSENIISYNPMVSTLPIPRSIKAKTQKRILEASEIQKMLKEAKRIYDKYKGKFGVFFQIYPLVLLALATGARRGELLGLEWKDIDFKNSNIKISKNLVEIGSDVFLETPKTESSIRMVYVDEDVIKVLKDLQKVSRGSFVFSTREGKHMTPSHASKAYRNLRDSVDIEGVRFHDLRHTHASLLIAEGVDYKTVSQRIGHSDIRTTLNLYTHTVVEKEKEAANKMGKFLM